MLEVLEQSPLALITVTTLVSLVVGSFLNVVIYRLPKQLEAQWSQEQPKEAFNIAVPASHCPSCRAPIKAWQNIPVLSWLLLKGQCANCKTRISARYPLIEAFTGLFGGLLAWQVGFDPKLIYLLLCMYLCMAMFWIDVDHYLLPDTLTLSLLWAGLVANSFGLFTDLNSAVWGAVAGYLALWLVFWGFKLATGKEGMGYGDFKLLAAIGAWMGWQVLAMVILVSSLVGAVLGIGAILLAGRDKAKPIPFGPYLILAAWIVYLFGAEIQAIILI